jgi:hypothetical protein
MLPHFAPSASKSRGWLLAAVLGAALLATTGCNGSSDTGGNNGTDGGGAGGGGGNGTGGGGGNGTGGGGGSSTPPDAGTCSPDPLLTKLPPLFNGNSVDMYDCPILQFTAKYNEPDAMIFKAIIYVESRFQYDAVGCTGNSGCCPQSGWTGEECGCLGPMQTGPQCGGSSTLGLLPDGHVDLETNPSASDWQNSVFNPEVNIELGISGIAGNRAQVKQQFSGCTEDQYTMMAVGNFNNYGSTQSCTVYNTTYDNAVLDAYKQYSAASGWPAHAY